MLSGSLKVQLASLFEFLLSPVNNMISDGHVDAVQIVSPGQPGLHCGDILHRLGELGHDKEEAFLKVRVVGVEFHLVVVVGQLHLEDREVGLVVGVEEADPGIDRADYEVFQLFHEKTSKCYIICIDNNKTTNKTITEGCLVQQL